MLSLRTVIIWLGSVCTVFGVVYTTWSITANYLKYPTKSNPSVENANLLAVPTIDACVDSHLLMPFQDMTEQDRLSIKPVIPSWDEDYDDVTKSLSNWTTWNATEFYDSNIARWESMYRSSTSNVLTNKTARLQSFATARMWKMNPDNITLDWVKYVNNDTETFLFHGKTCFKIPPMIRKLDITHIPTKGDKEFATIQLKLNATETGLGLDPRFKPEVAIYLTAENQVVGAWKLIEPQNIVIEPSNQKEAYKVSYESVESDLLPHPYQTECLDYPSHSKYKSRSHCVNECSKRLSLNASGKYMPGTALSGNDSKGGVLSPYVMFFANKTQTGLGVKGDTYETRIRDKCSKQCINRDCHDVMIKVTLVKAVNGRPGKFSINVPEGFIVRMTYTPEASLLSFLAEVAAWIALWTGLSAVAVVKLTGALGEWIVNYFVGKKEKKKKKQEMEDDDRERRLAAPAATGLTGIPRPRRPPPFPMQPQPGHLLRPDGPPPPPGPSSTQTRRPGIINRDQLWQLYLRNQLVLRDNHPNQNRV